MTQDVTILYQGGCGGFALFYYLLLTGRYQTGLEYQSVAELIKRQFSQNLATDPAQWKNHEHWPDNQYCRATKSSPRLYLICNPCATVDLMYRNLDISRGTTKYFIYTDIKTQLRMAWAKKAHWFNPGNRRLAAAPCSDIKYIRQILSSAKDNLDPKFFMVKELFQPHVVNLKDFVCTKTVFGQPAPNQLQLDFLEHWIQLQPKTVAKYLSCC